jgi:hypothetical protein
LGNYVSLRGIEGIAFTCPGSMPKWEPITFEESLSFVKKIKVRKFTKRNSQSAFRFFALLMGSVL